MDKIIIKENQYDSPCIGWNTEQIENFLKDLHFISPNTLSRSLTFLRDFVEYICNSENLKCPEYKLIFGKLYDLVDYNKLLRQVITFEQYKHIKNQLDLNIRDKVIFELAWLLLNPDEIKNLKEKDIEFIEDKETEMEIIWLKISDTKKIEVKDPEIVEDIKKCIKENNYYIDSSDGKQKVMRLKYSEYLIKPVNVGRSKKSEQISNPSLSLQMSLKQQEITCTDKEVSEMNIKSVRRSKLIFLCAPQNEKYFDEDLIMMIIGSGNVRSYLYWLKKIAKMIYKK